MEDGAVDPRIRRTRTALREAVAALLRERSFDDITLHEIAQAAGLNRATIYKHYPDKFALLDALIADELRERIFAAIARCEPTGAAKLAAVLGATCECARWVATIGRADDRLLRPIAEARMLALVGRAVEFALDERVALPVVKRELAVAMGSAAICGAATAWAASGSVSQRALEAHVAKALAALSTLIVPNPTLPKMIRSLTF
jgi:AcrR family transcriptional regulator